MLLIKVLNVLLLAAGDRKSLGFVPSHLSATFDTMDRCVPLKCLKLRVALVV